MKKFNFHTYFEKFSRCASLKDETTASANISQQILFICQPIKIVQTSEMKLHLEAKRFNFRERDE